MTTAEREPNVIWAGEGEPPAWYMDGREAVVIPTAETARAGFFTPDPLRLVRLSGGGFKLYVKKGTESALRSPRVKSKTKRS